MISIPSKILKSILYYFLFFFLLIQSCEKNSSPLESISSQYTSHNYRWEIDTLDATDAMQIYMFDIWGTDENNVWTVGHSDDNSYQIWHWNGVNWMNIDPGIYGDSPSYSEIFGFSVNDFWVVGSGSYRVGIDPELHHREFILHFNGTQWTRYSELKAPACLSIWGLSSSDLYFGCDSGVVLYKNGVNWEKQSIGNDAQIISLWGFNATQIFAIGYSWSTRQYYFFEKNQYRWTVSDSGNLKFGYFLWGLDIDHFFSVGGRGLYEYKNGQWVNTFYANSINSINGTNLNNIFMGGFRNNIYHFNGENWHHFAEFDNANQGVDGIWWNSSNVFIIIGDMRCSYILRGVNTYEN